MKGIILAGGSGTRLYPLTTVTSKQLLPVYDKPMVYYPLSTLMLAGIRDILVISTPTDLPNFERLLGDGSDFGVSFSYAEQPSPDGLAQAFLIGAEWVGDEPCALVLGDNIFHGNGLVKRLKHAVRAAEGGHATVFGYLVGDPERFGVVEFDSDFNAVSIEEKPERGELEITDLNRMYLENGLLNVITLGRGFAWLDTGTIESLYEASDFVRTVQRAAGVLVSVPEEVAYTNGWITRAQLLACADRYGKSDYGSHLRAVAEGSLVSDKQFG